MAIRTARRTVAILIVVIALGLLLPPLINVNRYRARMADSLSRALGRPVSIGSISLRLIPQPGFELRNVEIEDDPAFSNEPILRSERVTADLRLSSLWRGRLEIAKLTLQYPSLNFVQGPDGHWNIESLLWRASRTPVAPTGQRRAEARVRFPYVELDQGRMNFSHGVNKTVFAFVETDAALFSPEENQWRIRLEARPVRTDTNISDTGTVRADINFERAVMLRDTKVNGRIAWERGQLGMITKLIYGRDRGWRGGLALQSDVSGSPAELHFTATAAVQDFRRFDVYAGDPMGLAASCKGIASIPTYTVGFNCQMPAGSGAVMLTGNVGPGSTKYDVGFAAENVPVNSLLSLARHVKKDIPQDLDSTGTFNASATFRKTNEADANWSGDGSTSEMDVRSSLLKDPLRVRSLRMTLKYPPEVARTEARQKKNLKVAPKKLADAFLSITPVELALGAKTPATVGAQFSARGYEMDLSGGAELENLIGFGRTIGVSVPKVTLRGEIAMDIAVSGIWQGFPEPAVNGTAKLTNGRAEIPGIAQQVIIKQSDVALDGNEFLLRSMQGQVGEVKFSGWTKVPRHCEADVQCGPLVDLDFDEIDVAKVNELLNPNLKKQPWYRLFGSSKDESLLTKVYAVGRFTAKKLVLDKLTATKLFADFRLNQGDLLISGINAEVMNGIHSGEWHADFRGSTPVYSGSGRIARMNVAQLATVTKGAIGSGVANGGYQLKMTGWTAAELAQSAEGNATFDWMNPTIRVLAAGTKGPAKISDFTGKLAYKDGVLSFNDSKMATSNGVYAVTGTATNEKLALTMTSESAAGYKVTGSLRAPVVAVTELGIQNEGKRPKTEASLKQP